MVESRPAVDIHATRLMADQAAWRADRGENVPEVGILDDQDFRHRNGRARVDRAMQAFGGDRHEQRPPLDRSRSRACTGSMRDRPRFTAGRVAKHLLRGG